MPALLATLASTSRSKQSKHSKHSKRFTINLFKPRQFKSRCGKCWKVQGSEMYGSGDLQHSNVRKSLSLARCWPKGGVFFVHLVPQSHAKSCKVMQSCAKLCKVVQSCAKLRKVLNWDTYKGASASFHFITKNNFWKHQTSLGQDAPKTFSSSFARVSVKPCNGFVCTLANKVIQWKSKARSQASALSTIKNGLETLLRLGQSDLA